MKLTVNLTKVCHGRMCEGDRCCVAGQIIRQIFNKPDMDEHAMWSAYSSLDREPEFLMWEIIRVNDNRILSQNEKMVRLKELISQLGYEVQFII